MPGLSLPAAEERMWYTRPLNFMTAEVRFLPMRNPFRSRRGLFCLALGLCVSALSFSAPAQQVENVTAPHAGTPSASSEASPLAQARSADQEIRIAGGDLLEIKVFGVSELSGDVRVNNSGDISIPLAGTVHLDGLTNAEAQKLLESKLVDGGFMKDPHVSIFVREYATQGVSILGEVQRPGVYPLLGQRRLFDALSIAGGTTPRAGKTITITHRNAPSQPMNVQLSNRPEKNAEANVAVSPGDTIFVSRAGVVYVVGDVNKPSGFVMDNNEHMTVLQALAMAGGANATASLESAKILRKSSSGVQEIPIPLKSIMMAKKEDVSLAAEDVLFVPQSAGKSVARRSAEAILQMTTGVIIYRR